MSYYRKNVEEGTFEHRFYRALGFPPVSDSEGDIPLVIRITLGDMGLLDGFYMSIPADACDLSIEDAIRKYVLCESEEDRLNVKRRLFRDPNPDMVDIYDALLYLYEQVEIGKFTLSYHINNGAPDIQPTDPVSLHQCLCKTDGDRSYRLLDLVLDLDPFSGLTSERKDAMLMDFRGIFILYLMDKFGYQPGLQDTSSVPPFNSPRGRGEVMLKSQVSGLESNILKHLASEDIGLIRAEGGYSITPKGHDLLSNIIDEAEFYIVNYDLFGDVDVNGSGEIRFNTGYGDNLIVPVFLREGIDPYRALFVVALYLGSMDELASNTDTRLKTLDSRLEASSLCLESEEPFKELFSLIAYSPTEEEIGTELLDRIIREGRLKVEKRRLREERLKHIESIEQRINN